MIRIIVTLLMVVFVINQSNAAPPDDFVIVIKSDNPGVSTSTQFLIPIYAFSNNYNYNVDCNDDGILEANAQAGSYTCNYSIAGTYTIRIKDNSGAKTGFPAISFNNTGDKLKIISLSQWGTGVWDSMIGAFYGTSNMTVDAEDTPDLSMVGSMRRMFKSATLANPDTSNWNTSAVISMRSIFEFATSANPDTSGWNTVSVTSMRSMFEGASSANPDTSNWNTAVVTDMRRMFSQATLANPDTSNWDISSVLSMVNMFFGVTLPPNDYDAVLIGFSNQNVQSGVSFDGGNSIVCSSAAQAARDKLINVDAWNIMDGGVCVVTEEIFSDGFETTL